MPVSSTAPGCPGTRVDAPVHVAFRTANGVGTRDFCTFSRQRVGRRDFTASLSQNGA